VFQIVFPTSTKFLRIFLTVYLFFLCENLFLKKFEKGNKADTWGPPVIGSVATRQLRALVKATPV
jgi:hypothetical protein